MVFETKQQIKDFTGMSDWAVRYTWEKLCAGDIDDESILTLGRVLDMVRQAKIT